MPHIFHGFRALVFVMTLAAGAAPAWGQSSPPPLQVLGLSPGGLRISMTERWGEISYTVRNFSEIPRLARVSVFHQGQEYAEYARDLWVLPHTSVTSWMSVGPLPTAKPGDKPFSQLGRTIYYVLYDRTDGTSVVVKPSGDEKLRDRAVLYRPDQEWSTAIFCNESVLPDESSFRQPTPSEEATTIARVMRGMARQSEFLSLVREPNLPTTAESYDSIDEIILASNRLKFDALSRTALRQWVERGGQLWVMLDQVEGDLLESLLGEECAPQILDRTSLTTLHVQRKPNDPATPIPESTPGKMEFEYPVSFVRVGLTGRETVHHYVDAWPAAFSIRIGRGRILVTTLSPRAWYRSRKTSVAPEPVGRQRGGALVTDPPSPFEKIPDLPVAREHLLELFSDWKPTPHTWTTEDLRPLLEDEIGYTVPARSIVVGILAGFLAALVIVGVVVRRSRRPELTGWLIPTVAVAAGGVFYVLGGQNRYVIPPTVAIAEIADAVPGSGEVARTGIVGFYQPEGGQLRLTSNSSGILNFDFDGLENQSRVRVQTDRDSWYYEKLAVPAGVRQGLYRTTLNAATRVTATFGPEGVQGTLLAESFANPEDAILVARDRRPIAAEISHTGTFTIGRNEILGRGQFMTGAVLTDRQQRRQSIYQKLVGQTLPEYYDNRDFLMAWTTPQEIPYQGNEGSRKIGSSLLVVPVDYERPAAGTKVYVPPAFLPYRRWVEGRTQIPTMELTRPIDMQLRFQLPPALIPLIVEQANFAVKIRAPGRRIVLKGYSDGQSTPLREIVAPADPIEVEVRDPRYLQIDEAGGIYFGVGVQEIVDSSLQADAFWSIESIQLQLTGRIPESR